jgi:AcrR family transcriptional regulator
MTIYHHVPSKEKILDGMVDIVFGQIERPPTNLTWQEAIRVRCISMRRVLNRHSWASPLMESRQFPGHETMLHHDAVLGCFINGGLSLEMAAHAYAILDSYVYGFALEEANLPEGGGEEIVAVAKEMVELIPKDIYPNFYKFTSEHVVKHPGYSFGNSFEFGLDLIIDGLANAARSN